MLKCDKKNKEYLDDVMSNFDHSINKEIVEKLKTTNSYSGYSALNFHGDVWFESNLFHCEIWQYHSHINTISKETLEEIMEEASNEYGYE